MISAPRAQAFGFDADELITLNTIDDAILPRLDLLYQPQVVSYNPPWERLCPACREPLHSYNYLYTSDIRLDSCDRCGGVWVDDGELQKMVQVLQDARAAEVPPDTQAQLTLIEAEAQHRATMANLHLWSRLFQFMRARPRIPL